MAHVGPNSGGHLLRSIDWRSLAIRCAWYVEDMATEASLRPALPEDREFLFGLHKASMGSYVEELFGPWDDAVQWEFFDRWFRLDHTFVIKLGDEDVGVIAFEERAGDLYVTRMEVHPDRQNQGIGTAVLRQLLDRIHGAGNAVSLHVFEINPARELYQRLGFVVSSGHDGRLFMRATPRRHREGGPAQR